MQEEYRQQYGGTQTEPPPVPQSASVPQKLGWQIGASIACSAIALLFIPILFGAVGTMLGGYVFFKGEKPIGFALIVGGVAAAILGTLIGMTVAASQYGY